MKKLLKSRKLQLALASLLLASCATSTNPSYVAYTENELKILRTSQFGHTADGAMMGAATGAAVGAGSAALSGGDKKDIQKGAISGGIVGGLGGGILGFKKGDEKGKDQIQHRRLTSAERKQLSQLTQEAKKKEAIATRALNRLNSQIAAGTLSQKQARTEAKALLDALDDGFKPIASSQFTKSPEGKELNRLTNRYKSLRTATAKMAKEGTQQKISA